MPILDFAKNPSSYEYKNEEKLKIKLSKGFEDTLLKNQHIPLVKKLLGGEILGVKTWISDIINPGYVGYQLILREFRGRYCSMTTQFPTNWEEYTKEEVIEMYDSIRTIDDWHKIRNNELGRK